jgi:hypothetical protein
VSPKVLRDLWDSNFRGMYFPIGPDNMGSEDPKLNGTHLSASEKAVELRDPVIEKRRRSSVQRNGSDAKLAPDVGCAQAGRPHMLRVVLFSKTTVAHGVQGCPHAGTRFAPEHRSTGETVPHGLEVRISNGICEGPHSFAVPGMRGGK